MTTAAAGKPPVSTAVPDWSARLRGLGVWLLLMSTILGTAYLIRHFFADDVLHRKARVADLVQTAEILIGQGGHVQLSRAVRTLESVLKDDPLNTDALLLLEQARGSASEGTEALARTIEMSAQTRAALQDAAAKSPTDPEPRFLLARMLAADAERLSSETRYHVQRGDSKAAERAAGESKAAKASADAALAEARSLAEARVKDRPNDEAAAFLLARILRSKTPTDDESYREAARLVRLAGRPESELRIAGLARVPPATSLERARIALDRGLLPEASAALTAVYSEDRENRDFQFLWAELTMWDRADSDRAVRMDATLEGLLKAVCEAPDAPVRARFYLAALEAMGNDADKARAKERYAKASADVAAGFDLIAEADRLIALKRYGNARLLLTAENLLGAPGTRQYAAAALRRAELALQQSDDEKRPTAVSDAADRLKALADKTQPADMPARAFAYLAAMEPNTEAARALYNQATAKGFDALADVEALGKREMYVAARWLLKAAADSGFGLSGNPADPKGAERDSELWYQYGRTYAAGGAMQFGTAVVHYLKAVEVGKAQKTKGAGKAALSIARVYSNMGEPAKLEEAAALVALARACGVEKMDITSADKILANIAKAADASRMSTGAKVAPH